VKINPVSSSAFPQKASRPVYSKMSSDSWEQATGVFPAKWEEQLEKCINDWKNK
jgi:dTDP-4-dehydrorhamnose reductase